MILIVLVAEDVFVMIFYHLGCATDDLEVAEEWCAACDFFSQRGCLIPIWLAWVCAVLVWRVQDNRAQN